MVHVSKLKIVKTLKNREFLLQNDGSLCVIFLQIIIQISYIVKFVKMIAKMAVVRLYLSNSLMDGL